MKIKMNYSCTRMKKIFSCTLGFLIFAPNVFALDFNFEIPIGEFAYQNKFFVEKKRTSKTVDVSTLNGSRELKELRGKGYICIRKNKVFYLCSLIEEKPESPPGLRDFLLKKFESFYVSFSSSGVQPILLLDTSTEQEWLVRESVKINGMKVPFYKFVYYYNTNEVKIVFPVDEEQRIPLVGFLSKNLLSFGIVINFQPGIAYLVNVYLEQ